MTECLCPTIQVTGELVTEPNLRYSFARVDHTVYSRGQADANQSSGKKGKLVGKLSWPFAISLPRTVELEEDGVKKSFRLPGHLYLRWGRSDILYRVLVTVAYGSMFNPDHTYVFFLLVRWS